MKNTTISLDEKTLEDGRKYAEQLGYSSFNSWVQKLIRDAIKGSSKSRMENLLGLAAKCNGNSQGKQWSKDEIYER